MKSQRVEHDLMTKQQHTCVCVCVCSAPSGKKPVCPCRRSKRHGFNPWVQKIPWRRKWQPTPVFWPGKSDGQRSLVGYSPWGHKESDLTEHTHACTCIAHIKHADSITAFSVFMYTLHIIHYI